MVKTRKSDKAWATTTKGSEEMEGMTESQTRKLIEWLKSQGFDSEKVVECLEYINSKK